jgi:predicted porin
MVKMKKSLPALAILAAFSGIACAQSAVTVYGSFDAGLRYQNNQNDKGNSRLTLNSTGTYNSNRLGFRGVEDLGGGLNAHFTLETGFFGGSGAVADNSHFFNRSAFVGLGGDWGTLDFGRQYTVAFKTVGAYDPFNYKYTNIIPLAAGSTVAAGTRYDNDIQYNGTFGPITARAEWQLGEQTGSARNASSQALGASYANGPVAFGAAYTLRKPNVAGANATPNYQEERNWTLGGAYKFGDARVAAGYSRDTQDLAAGSNQQKNMWLGGSYDLTPAMALAAAYYDTRVSNYGASANINGKRQLFIVGATYALSRRTNLYADIDYARFSDALRNQQTAIAGGSQLAISSPSGNQTGVSVGMNHLF